MALLAIAYLQAFWSPYAYIGEFLTSRRLWPFIRQCQNFALTALCAQAVSHVFYGPSDQIALDDWALIVNTWPGIVASRDITHWAQVSLGLGGMHRGNGHEPDPQGQADGEW